MTYDYGLKLQPPRKPVRRRRAGVRRGRIIDAVYRRYVASQPCCVTDAPPPSDPHHVRIGNPGMATKPSDYQTVPLAHAVHRFLEDHGPDTFYDHYGYTQDQLLMEAMRLKARYDAALR